MQINKSLGYYVSLYQDKDTPYQVLCEESDKDSELFIWRIR